MERGGGKQQKNEERVLEERDGKERWGGEKESEMWAEKDWLRSTKYSSKFSTYFFPSADLSSSGDNHIHVARLD